MLVCRVVVRSRISNICLFQSLKSKKERVSSQNRKGLLFNLTNELTDQSNVIVASR